LIDELPEPTRSIVTLVIVGSLRIGEVTALRWGRIHPDRIEVVERFYEGEFDDTKTDAGRRSIPLDSFGILRAVLDVTWQTSKYRKPEDLVFSNRRTCEPAKSTAAATQANSKEARFAGNCGLQEFPNHALKPHEQCWGSA
jgi:integrase